MFAAILLVLAMQSPTVLQSQASGFPVLGKLIPSQGLPPDFQMALIEVTLENEEGRPIDRTLSSPNGDFRFNRVMIGRYWLVIDGEKFQGVRHRLEIDVRTFGVVNVSILLRPLVVTNRTAEEETVSVDTLRRKLPKDAVKAYDKALEEQRKGKAKEAISGFQKSIRLAPDFFEAHLQLALQYQRAGDSGEAMKSLEKAVELNPATTSGRTMLGRLYYESGQYQKAADVLAPAGKQAGVSADAYFFLGSSYYKLNTLDLAEANLLQTLELSREFGQAHLQLYNVYMKGRRPEKALEQLDAYLEHFPNAADHAAIKEQAGKLRQMIKR
jgi:Tfp pilus assembly protein PilF